MPELSKANAAKLESRYRGAFSGTLLVLSVVFALLGSTLTLAQHDMHGMSNVAGLKLKTMPANDAVLAKAPSSIMLDFESDVRLVKLALKETRQGEILIDFRYTPSAGKHYLQKLPKLAAANYYKVEWAALKAGGDLVKGSFYFSFGEDAKPASHYMEQMDHQMLVPSPDYRLL